MFDLEDELRVAALPQLGALAQAEGLPIFAPNTAKEEKPKDTHLRISILPVTPAVISITKGCSVYEWVLQVNIYVRDDEGDAVPSNLIGKLRAAFPYAHKFAGANHSFQVFKPANARPPVPVDGWYLTPIQFRIRTIS